MKILYISNAVIPSEQSRGLSISRVCQAFADAGHEVLLFSISPSNETRSPVEYYGLKGGFRHVPLRLKGWLNNRFMRHLMITGLIMALRSRAVLRAFRPDIVYSRLTSAELLFVPKATPILYEMHSLGPLKGSLWERRLFKRMIRTKHFRRIIVTTNLLTDLLKSHLPQIETIVARLSADPPIDIPLPDLGRFKKANLWGNRFAHHVGYTGFLDSYGLRGTDIICQVASQIPTAAFHVVGGDPSTVDFWRKFATAWNGHENIFFYGYRKPDEIPYFLNCFDVVMAPLQKVSAKRAPSGKNMSPLKLPQYMGYKKTIIASNIPSHAEILRHDRNALLVKPDDVGAWRDAIEALLKDKEKRIRLGTSAYLDYAAEFTPHKRVQKILSGISI